MNTSNPTSKSSLLLPLSMFLVSFLSIYFLFSSPTGEFNSNDLIRFSVQPSESTIHTSSETISMVASLKTKDFKLPSRKPIDLVCVVDFSGAREERYFEEVQSSLRKVLPLMNDQDRLSIVILDKKSPSELIIIPLTNTTQQNKDIIFFTNATPSSQPANNNITYGSFKTAVDILNKRDTANPTTGIILFSSYWNRDELDEIFQSLTSQNESQNFLYNYPAETREWGFVLHEPFYYLDLPLLREAFEQSLVELQTSNLATLDLLIKFETESGHENEVLSTTRSLNIVPEKEKKFILYNIKVPKVTYPSWRSSMGVKIASCELVFTPLGGRKIVKNADLTVNVVKDEKDIEKGSSEFFKYVFAVEATLHQRPERITLYKGHEGAVKVLQRDVEIL